MPRHAFGLDEDGPVREPPGGWAWRWPRRCRAWPVRSADVSLQPLTRFVTCSPVWTAQDLLDALGDAALRTGRRSPLADRAVTTRPAVLFAAMLANLDEQGDYPGPAFPTGTAPVPGPVCARPGCDGWITTLDNAGSVTAARPCPQVDLRRATVAQADVLEVDGWDPEESPF